MISGNEWREAFWTGMLAGGCVGAVVTWLFWWWGERPRSQPPSQLAMKGGMYPPDHSVPVPPRRLTSQDIVDRAAGNPARQFCGFPVPGKIGLIPCGKIATQGCAFCEEHAERSR